MENKKISLYSAIVATKEPCHIDPKTFVGSVIFSNENLKSETLDLHLFENTGKSSEEMLYFIYLNAAQILAKAEFPDDDEKFKERLKKFLDNSPEKSVL